jgi:mono/diheme cytochrome c family protein
VRDVVFYATSRDVPTYDTDIQPLYDAVCSRCHSPQGGARLLDSVVRWRDEIDGVLSALGDGLMPPSEGERLTPAQVARIQLWKDTGMQETR